MLNRPKTNVSTPQSGKPKVLIIDGNSTDRHILDLIVKSWAEVDIRVNVWQAIKTLDAQGGDYAAIFIDGQMFMNSSLHAHLPRGVTGGARPWAIALMDDASRRTRRALLAKGATAVLCKPYNRVDVGELQERIQATRT